MNRNPFEELNSLDLGLSMAKKDKKSKTAEQKARVAAKQTKKAAQKEKKTKSKGHEGDDSDAEDVDLDAVLAEYAKQVGQNSSMCSKIACHGARNTLRFLVPHLGDPYAHSPSECCRASVGILVHSHPFCESCLLLIELVTILELKPTPLITFTLASPVFESHRSLVRATITPLVSYDYRLAVQQE